MFTPLRWILLASLSLLLGGGGLVAACAGPWQTEQLSPSEQVEAIGERMEPLLQQWHEQRDELAALHEQLRAEYRELPDPLVVAELTSELERTSRRRERYEAQLLDLLERAVTLEPQHDVTQRATREVLEPLCDEVRLLVAYRDEHVRTLYYDDGSGEHGRDAPVPGWPSPASVRYRAEMTTLEAIEEELGAALTALQRRFPNDDSVQALDRKVVYEWHYRQLIQTLGRNMAPQQQPWNVERNSGLDGSPRSPALAEGRESLESVNRELLAQLERMKRLYPHSPFTRRAEQWIIEATAKRNLTDLQGWPVVMLLALVTLLVFGFIRCLTAYLRRRQEDEPIADSRIIRPAPWTQTTPAPIRREPNHPLTRSSPPSVRRDPPPRE